MSTSSVEFTVVGIPASAQAVKDVKDAWQGKVRQEAAKAIGDRGMLIGDLQVKIRGFADGPLRPDLDNMAKPILDAMEGITYANDRRIVNLDVKFRTLGEPFIINRVSSVMTSEFESGRPFVYIHVSNDVQRVVI